MVTALAPERIGNRDVFGAADEVDLGFRIVRLEGLLQHFDLRLSLRAHVSPLLDLLFQSLAQRRDYRRLSDSRGRLWVHRFQSQIARIAFVHSQPIRCLVWNDHCPVSFQIVDGVLQVLSVTREVWQLVAVRLG